MEGIHRCKGESLSQMMGKWQWQMIWASKRNYVMDTRPLTVCVCVCVLRLRACVLSLRLCVCVSEDVSL